MKILHPYCGTGHDFTQPCPRVAAQYAPLLDATWMFWFIDACDRRGMELPVRLTDRPETTQAGRS